MPVNVKAYRELFAELQKRHVKLVAVSKTKSVDEINELYNLGHRDFAENYVQELIEKKETLPEDIRWHFIGHLQSNKVKQIVSFVHLIQGVDSIKLLAEINKQGAKQDRIINCLLQVHISSEETKFGFDQSEVPDAISRAKEFQAVKIKGLMGMASFSMEEQLVRDEFLSLKKTFDQLKNINADIEILSMGMSGDYRIAVEEGSNMVRIGSLLFGERNYAR